MHSGNSAPRTACNTIIGECVFNIFKRICNANFRGGEVNSILLFIMLELHSGNCTPRTPPWWAPVHQLVHQRRVHKEHCLSLKCTKQCKLHQEPWRSAKCTRNTLVKIAVHPAQYLLHLLPKGVLGVQWLMLLCPCLSWRAYKKKCQIFSKSQYINSLKLNLLLSCKCGVESWPRQLALGI